MVQRRVELVNTNGPLRRLVDLFLSGQHGQLQYLKLNNQYSISIRCSTLKCIENLVENGIKVRFRTW